MTVSAHDVVIVGGGVGGLTAASYLGRFRRPTLVVDAGASRARWIPESHNIPGFPEGIGGKVLLARLRKQAEHYGADLRTGQVESITRVGDGFSIEGAGIRLQARYVVLAAGVEDYLPALAGAEEALLRSVLRVCPICDGYEASGKRIAVVGDGPRGQKEAAFLRTYSENVSYLHVGRPLNQRTSDQLAQQGIEPLQVQLDQMTIERGSLALSPTDCSRREFDVFYSALGCRPRTETVAVLGATTDENHALTVNAHQMCSIDGLYAVGDMVRGLNQVIVAAAEAAVAATDIHNRLRSLGR